MKIYIYTQYCFIRNDFIRRSTQIFCTFQGRRKFWKCGEPVCSNLVGIICPPPSGWDKIRWSANIWGSHGTPRSDRPSFEKPVFKSWRLGDKLRNKVLKMSVLRNCEDKSRMKWPKCNIKWSLWFQFRVKHDKHGTKDHYYLCTYMFRRTKLIYDKNPTFSYITILSRVISLEQLSWV